MGIIDKKIITYYTLEVINPEGIRDDYNNIELLEEIPEIINHVYFSDLEIINMQMVDEWFENACSNYKKKNKVYGYKFKIGIFIGYK